MLNGVTVVGINVYYVNYVTNTENRIMISSGSPANEGFSYSYSKREKD